MAMEQQLPEGHPDAESGAEQNYPLYAEILKSLDLPSTATGSEITARIQEIKRREGENAPETTEPKKLPDEYLN